jgi:predicted nucleic acid-binding protein
MIYLDTSYIVKCYLREAGTEKILNWLQGKSGIYCCLHGRLEFFAAIRRHVREGRLTEKNSLYSLHLLKRDEKAGIWQWIPISEQLIHAACTRMASLRSDVYMRAADALHLACAVENGFSAVYSHDRHLLAAAEYFGLEGRDII